MTNLGFVIDNRKCIGCHACTVACKSEHDVPIGVNRTHVKYIEIGTYPDTSREFSVHRCNHCEYAPCTTICPTTALFTRFDGIVDFDDERCIGCKSCMQACPYDALYIDPNKGTAAKCNYCAHRIENSYEPACVIVCPVEAIVSGDLDDPNSSISNYVEEHEVTVRKPEAGTKPQVYYVETSHEMLDPLATQRGAYAWTEQAAGVGHFAKYASKRLSDADTPSMLVQLALEVKARNAAPRDQAIIKDVAERLNNDQLEIKRAYDQPSKGILWDNEVAGYILAKAAATGAYILCMLDISFGLGLLNFPISNVILFSVGMLSVTGLLLISDLDRPERFLYVILRPNWNSWLVKGAYTISGFAFVLFVHGVMLWYGVGETYHVMLACIGIPLAWLTGTYTGWLLKQAKGRPQWADKSNASIAIQGSLEMLFFGGLLHLAATIILLYTSTFLAMTIILLSVLMFTYIGFLQIRGDLRKAQMESLL